MGDSKRDKSKTQAPLSPHHKGLATGTEHEGGGQRAKNSIKTASVDHVAGLTAIPYTTSEVNRRQWEDPIGSIDAIEVDGEPIVTAISEAARTFLRDYPADEVYTLFSNRPVHKASLN